MRSGHDNDHDAGDAGHAGEAHTGHGPRRGRDHAHDHTHDHRRAPAGRLLAAFVLLTGFAVVEIVSAFAFGSLALLSDAGHMVTDVVGIGMALAAARLAVARRVNERRTFGLYRLEILGALANAALLLGMAGYIMWSALGDVGHAEDLDAGPLLVVAVLGLGANIGAFLILRSGAGENLNTEAAYVEVLADLFGSLGVILAAGVMHFTGWTWVDPVVGVGLAAWIVPRTVRLALQALHILLEGAPRGVDVARVRADLLRVTGVADVHDLHLWTVASGMELCSVHIRTAEGADLHAVLDEAERLLRDDHGVAHVTLQLEPSDHHGCVVAEQAW